MILRLLSVQFAKMSDVMETTSDDQAKSLKKPTKRAMLMRGVVTPVFGLLAVLFIALGLLNATIWKPSALVVAHTSVAGARYVVSDPGVLKMVDTDAQVTVASSGSKSTERRLCVATGSAKDVAGWTADTSYTRLTGLKDWSTFTVKNERRNQGSKPVNDGGGVPFAHSDMWRQVTCGEGRAHLSVEGLTDDQVVIVDTHPETTTGAQDSKHSADASPVRISVEWTRHQLPNYAMPLYVAGGVFVLLAVFSASVLAMDLRRLSRKWKAGRHDQPREAEEVTIAEALGGTCAVLRSSFRHSRRSHRRAHAASPASSTQPDMADTLQADGETVPSGQSERPQVIDPSARNMVAELRAQTGVRDAEVVRDSDSAARSVNVADAGQPVVQSSVSVTMRNDGVMHEDGRTRSVSSVSEASQGEDEPTMVYSKDDFETYFARLRHEDQKGGGSGEAQDPSNATLENRSERDGDAESDGTPEQSTDSGKSVGSHDSAKDEEGTDERRDGGDSRNAGSEPSDAGDGKDDVDDAVRGEQADDDNSDETVKKARS